MLFSVSFMKKALIKSKNYLSISILCELDPFSWKDNLPWFSRNRDTIEHPEKHAHCQGKSWHVDEIVSRFLCSFRSQFEAKIQHIR